MRNKILILSGLFLLSVIGVQSYYLYELIKRIDTIEPGQPVSLLKKSDDPGKLTDDFFNMDPWDPKNRDPFEEMRRMQDDINRLFGDSFSRFQGGELFDDSLATPALDMREEDDRYVFEIDIPGADESTINVSIDDERIIRIKETTRRSEIDGNGQPGILLRRERFVGKFQRTVSLPEPVDSGSLRSEYDDGVLKITVKKKQSVS